MVSLIDWTFWNSSTYYITIFLYIIPVSFRNNIFNDSLDNSREVFLCRLQAMTSACIWQMGMLSSKALVSSLQHLWCYIMYLINFLLHINHTWLQKFDRSKKTATTNVTAKPSTSYSARREVSIWVSSWLLMTFFLFFWILASKMETRFWGGI